MKYDWLIEKNGSHFIVTLRVPMMGQQWVINRAIHKDEWSNKLYRDNTLTMMIDDMFRQLGRTYIQLPKETANG